MPISQTFLYLQEAFFIKNAKIHRNRLARVPVPKNTIKKHDQRA